MWGKFSKYLQYDQMSLGNLDSDLDLFTLSFNIRILDL